MNPLQSVIIGILMMTAINQIESLNWVIMRPTLSVPGDAIVGGREENSNYNGDLLIGRKQIDNEMVIGKIINQWVTGYFPKDGKEHSFNHYEVLCGSNYNWQHLGQDNEKAFKGGWAGNGEPFYVCSAPLNGHKTPGKFYKPTGCCYVVSYGQEHCMKDYDIMIET